MKGSKILFSLGLLFAINTVFAQVMVEDTTENEPFLKAAKFKSSGYTGFEMQPTQILKSKAGMIVGFNLNWVINHRFVVSAKYHTLSSQTNIRPVMSPGSDGKTLLIHHFAGAAFSYIFFQNKKFSLQPELAAGWCSAKFEYPANSTNRNDYGAIIPAVYGVFNAHKNFRVGAGVNYRAVLGKNYFNITPAHLSGVAGVIFIRAGTF
ncbi:MAG: hypothetical protein KIS94_09325 [Chitinophagales bacterium]|nr:hypothetical protein [Chitinophagales bacterium]